MRSPDVHNRAHTLSPPLGWLTSAPTWLSQLVSDLPLKVYGVVGRQRLLPLESPSMTLVFSLVGLIPLNPSLWSRGKKPQIGPTWASCPFFCLFWWLHLNCVNQEWKSKLRSQCSKEEAVPAGETKVTGLLAEKQPRVRWKRSAHRL